MSDKKTLQLGMNSSTASNRLVKDVLYELVVKTGQNTCFQCSLPMTRGTFSVEHKIPWLDSGDPIGLFFDLDNISFSHHSCNMRAARRSLPPSECGTLNRYLKYKCRCTLCTEAKAINASKHYTHKKNGKNGTGVQVIESTTKHWPVAQLVSAPAS